MAGFFARTLTALGRLFCAFFALGTIALCAELGHHGWLVDLLFPWATGAWSALLVGFAAVTVLGALRLVLGAAPGSARDPLRHAARWLAPRRRLLGMSLAGAAAAGTVGGLALGPERIEWACTGVFLLGFLALRSRELPWFAGIRHASRGKVRFASSRFHPLTALFLALLFLLGGLALLPVLQTAAIPVTGALVLGWLSWSLPIAHVTVGKDGVQVSHWRERFYPFDGSVAASVDHDRVLVVDEGSRHRSLPFAPLGDAERARLAEAIRQHLVPPDPETIRADRSANALAAALESRDGAGGYRVAEVPRETLWRIVESRAVAPRVRIRAAELVVADPHEDDLPRLRRVADELAEPATAEAIETIARRATA